MRVERNNTTTMKITINKEVHTVVYIEYKDGLPFNVKTIFYVPTAKTPFWRLVDWDFFPNNGDCDDMRYFESGSGGTCKDIPAPKWVDGYIGKFWLGSGIKLKGRVKNGLKLASPKRLQAYYNNNFKTSINPFLCAEETHSREHCEMCGHESTEFCDKHKYMDDDGNDRWLHNKQYV